MSNPYNFGTDTGRTSGRGAIGKLKRYRLIGTICCAIVLIAVVPTVVVLALRDNSDDFSHYGSGTSRKNVTSRSESPQSWEVDWEMRDIPDQVKEYMAAVRIEEQTLELTTDGQNAEVFSRRVTPSAESGSPFSILLLHGAAFSSKNWADVETLQLLGAMGHEAVAIDLPGFGKSRSAVSLSSNKDKGDFLAAYIQHEKLSRPVIVSPSMSGSFSIPYIMNTNASTCTERTRGFVPVAPVATGTYTPDQYSKCEVPTMIVYGTEDKSLGVTSLENLRHLPRSAASPMQDALHAAYINKPEEWQKLVYNFVLALERLEGN